MSIGAGIAIAGIWIGAAIISAVVVAFHPPLIAIAVAGAVFSSYIVSIPHA